MMTTLTNDVKQFLNSDNPDGARETVERILGDLKRINANNRDFAALLALGSQQELEISLGVLGRKLIQNHYSINSEVLWLFLAAILSRSSIPANSPARISILGLLSCVEHWTLPAFALLTPALDSFLQVSLAQGSTLITEQTLDFLSTCEESYAQAPRTYQQIQAFKEVTNVVLSKVDDVEIQEEWSEGLELFFKAAEKAHFRDENIWSAGQNLLKKIYPNRILKQGADLNHYQVKDNINRFLLSSLSAFKNLYDRDFYQWTQVQVKYLKNQQWNELDLNNLIEEIDALGKQQKQELRNRLSILLGHLLKWQYQPQKQSNSWLATIRVQRLDIAELIEDNPSLKSYLEEALTKAYQKGRQLAIQETNLPSVTFPAECPYSLTEVLTDDFYPGGYHLEG